MNNISYWLDSVTLREFPTLSDKVDCEVCIIGGGITGITTAYLLAKAGLDVIVIDRDRLLQGTTGNSTAKITAQHGLIYHKLSTSQSLNVAQRYYKLNNDAITFIKNMIEQLSIDCDFKEAPAILYTGSKQYEALIDQEYEAYKQLNIPGKLVTDVPLPFSVVKALQMDGQAHFNPTKYLQALIEECVKLNVQFFEKCEATTIEYNKRPTVVLENGVRVMSKYIVQASHYPVHDEMNFFPLKMYAERAYVIAAKTKEYVNEMYINVESPSRSIRPVTINGENMLLFAGENHKTGQNDEQINHYDELKTFAHENFNVIEIKYKWSAQDYTTTDDLPFIGQLREDNQDILVATGYKKWGITTGSLAANLIAEEILQKQSKEQNIFALNRKVNLASFLRMNSDVVKHFVKGKIETANDSTLAQKEGKKLKVSGKIIGVYRSVEDEFHVVDTTCTHLGCEVNWNSEEFTWDCPCHGSRYRYDGKVINGPATKDLAHEIIRKK